MTFKFPPRNALGNNEIKAISKVIEFYKKKKVDPGYQGYFENSLCKRFSSMMGGGFTDACSSGTAATFIAISALNLKKGSEVLISPVTDSGPLNALILLGLKPKLIDSSPKSYNVSVSQFLKRISKKTKAAIIMHIGGGASEIHKISLAKRQGYKKTYSQLKKWKLNFNKLIFGKPSYDIFVDDKAFGFTKNWLKKFKVK